MTSPPCPTDRSSRFILFWLRTESFLKISFVVYLLARVIFYIVDSFSWTMDGDLSFLYYISWLMNEHDFVPYRDVHETSFFGTFIFYSTLTQLIGYSTTAFHIADTIYFALISLVTYRLLKPFGTWTALLAIGLFGEIYYQYGAGVHLQRDFIALLPAALALLLSQTPGILLMRRCFGVGLLFGIAACIKPQFGFGAIVVFLLMYFQQTAKQPSQLSSIQILTYMALYLVAGFILIVGSGFFWLYTHGVLNNFFDMVINYLPNYSSINGRNYARSTADALSGAYHWMSGKLFYYATPLCLSLFFIFYKGVFLKKQKLLFIFVLLLWVVYLSYVPMAGKYWEYHILPSSYFLAICLSGILIKPKSDSKKFWMPLTTFLCWLFFCWAFIFQQSFWISPNIDKKFNERSQQATAELAEFLKSHLHEGETVQPHVSHTHGFIFPALLKVGAIPATPYLENYLLYHDINTPFVRHARQQFLSTLQSHPPRYIIYSPSVFYFRGEGTETQFQPFEEWFTANYRLLFDSPDQPGQAASEMFSVYEYQGH